MPVDAEEAIGLGKRHADVQMYLFTRPESQWFREGKWGKSRLMDLI
jgi:hypothetical protein